jgi:4-aminobutyrate aminotransferase
MSELLSTVWTHVTSAQVVRGEGVHLYDSDGRRYLDFTSGIGVVNTGHCHPRVVEAIRRQAGELIFGQINCVIPRATVELAEALHQVTPAHIDRYFFTNSGAEATEACVKLAKVATGRPNIIVFQGSFHGRTHLTMAMTTSKTVYRHRFQPLPSGIFVAPFPYAYQYGWDEDTTVAFCIRQLDILLKAQTAPDETAAIIIEPVLGEGGYVPAPAAFLQHLRKVCDAHGILLVLDEVQSGFGRTGTFFCFQQSGVEPDVIIMAKGLGSGMPISAVASTRAIMDKWLPGTHGGTYGGGNALAATAARETIAIMLEEDLPAEAARKGALLMGLLTEVQQEFPVVGDVRGRGLMVATEFTRADGTPDPDTTAKVAKGCVDGGLLMLTCGTFGNVIRWVPPLVVTDHELREAVAIFRRSLAAAAGS